MNFKKYYYSLFGTWQARTKNEEDKKWFEVNSSLDYLFDLNTDNIVDDNEAPIFIFSAGWRSGSTLVQRVISSSGNIVVWGEPFDKSNIVQTLSSTMIPFSENWPPDDYYYKNRSKDELYNTWIANLYPDMNTLKASHRAFFDTLFCVGKERWGVKEVRWGKKEALYLKWLYPNSKLIFLVRNPFNSYLSYSSLGSKWYDLWPKRPIFTTYSFGKLWATLVAEFIDVSGSVDGFIVRYEDFSVNKENVVDKLAQYLGVEVDASILSCKVGGSKLKSISFLERAIIFFTTKREMNLLYK